MFVQDRLGCERWDEIRNTSMRSHSETCGRKDEEKSVSVLISHLHRCSEPLVRSGARHSQQSQSNGHSGVSPPWPNLSSSAVKMRRPSSVRLRALVPRLSVNSSRSSAGGLLCAFDDLEVELEAGSGGCWGIVCEGADVSLITSTARDLGFFGFTLLVGSAGVVLDDASSFLFRFLSDGPSADLSAASPLLLLLPFLPSPVLTLLALVESTLSFVLLVEAEVLPPPKMSSISLAGAAEVGFCFFAIALSLYVALWTTMSG